MPPHYHLVLILGFKDISFKIFCNILFCSSVIIFLFFGSFIHIYNISWSSVTSLWTLPSYSVHTPPCLHPPHSLSAQIVLPAFTWALYLRPYPWREAFPLLQQSLVVNRSLIGSEALRAPSLSILEWLTGFFLCRSSSYCESREHVHVTSRGQHSMALLPVFWPLFSSHTLFSVFCKLRRDWCRYLTLTSYESLY